MKKPSWKRYLESAGGWFVGEYAELIYNNLDEIRNDKALMSEFMKKVYRQAGRDSDIGGTKTRVYSVIKIIENGDLADALEYVIGSDRIRTQDPQAYLAAKEMLKKLDSKM